MSMIRTKFATANLVLAAAVANGGTLTLAYPGGTSQLSFNAGLAGTGHYVELNNNDKWAVGSPGIAVAFGASLITITNNSGYSWPAGTAVAVYLDQRRGKARIPLTIPLAAFSAIAVGDLVTEIRPGIEGTIEYWELVVGAPVTTGAKLATLNLEIDTTNVTGGTIAMTSAAATPMGKAIPCSDITGNNVLTRESLLSIEASAVTAFVEGNGYVVIYIRPSENDAY